ncbi:DUF3489 domain-containing protein [Henriciella sp.]|uniref:DUF3489 domain-containing protein n=1 Tax=Henriciella sp. TaxID=1968823 RepID=UPI002620F498|nr:DUF3489 domain-containing protein [Henriciella sp.]
MTSSHTLFFERPPVPGSKLAWLVCLLQEDATIDGLAVALRWQPHTVRAAMTRLRQRGYYIRRQAGVTGPSVYRICRENPFQL